MLLKCRDIMSLNTLKKMKLIAGESGLERVITWPYIVQTNSIEKWIFGGELLFFSGLGLDCDFNSLSDLLEEAARKNASGVIFLPNEQMNSKLIASLKSIADRLKMPIFELHRASIIVDITKEISNKIFEGENRSTLRSQFLETVCYGSPENINQLLNGINLDLKKPFQVAILYIDNIGTYLERLNMKNPGSATKFVVFYRQVVESIVDRYGEKLLTMYKDDYIYLAEQIATEQDADKFAQKLEEICHQINIYFKGLDVYACIGGTYHYTSISSSLLESERSMQLLKRMKKKKRVSIYEDLGVYQLFFHMKDSDLIQLQNQWIGKILLYDEKYGTDLIKTLDVLFKNKMNATDAAKELFIHRNTLNIRLNRIEKITDKNLKDPDTLNCLLFGVLIHHYLKRMQINN